MAAARKRELDIPRHVAAALGRSAVEAATMGRYVADDGRGVDWNDAVQAAVRGKRSIPPEFDLPETGGERFPQTVVQVSNETTLGATKRLVDGGLRPLALNFANGVHPGSGFLGGARAQEEVLCSNH